MRPTTKQTPTLPDPLPDPQKFLDSVFEILMRHDFTISKLDAVMIFCEEKGIADAADIAPVVRKCPALVSDLADNARDLHLLKSGEK